MVCLGYIKKKSVLQIVQDISSFITMIALMIFSMVIFGLIAISLLGTNFEIVGNLFGVLVFAFVLYAVLRYRQTRKKVNGEIQT